LRQKNFGVVKAFLAPLYGTGSNDIILDDYSLSTPSEYRESLDWILFVKFIAPLEIMCLVSFYVCHHVVHTQA
jgi:hypothetical protein